MNVRVKIGVNKPVWL